MYSEMSTENLIKTWNSVNLHNVVFHLAEAWDGITDKKKIMKCWKNIWPGAVNKEDKTANDNLMSN